MKTRRLRASESPVLQPTWALEAEHGCHSKERKNHGRRETMEDSERLVKAYISHSLMPTTKMSYK